MSRKPFPELEFLLSRISEIYGGRISTANDFESLSANIEQKAGVQVSASTLRRLWGYDNYESTPREYTLDCLAKYCGYDSFRDFRIAAREMPAFSSGFLSNECLFARDLQEGAHVLLGWNPNRMVELHYLGGYLFEVTRSVHSKLMVGDRFELTALVKGYPMFIPEVKRGSEILPLYVAGFKDGLTTVQKL